MSIPVLRPAEPEKEADVNAARLRYRLPKNKLARVNVYSHTVTRYGISIAAGKMKRYLVLCGKERRLLALTRGMAA